MVKRMAERAGLEMARHHPRGPRRAALLREHAITLVIDVGANAGQYASTLRAHGYAHDIVSFEPAPDPLARLRRRAAFDPRWQVRGEAASDHDGILELGAADNFSSVLPLEDRLARLFPESVPNRIARVRACRLDGAGLDLPASRNTLLKLDVQGYELQVLDGATGIFDALAMVETELSLVPLYRGQGLLSDVVARLETAGFGLRWLDPVLRDRTTGEYLQFDGLFVRR